MLRSVKYGLHGAVLAALAAAPLIWTSVDKTVDLVVDGRPHEVHTTAATVGDILRNAGYRVGPHDLVAPAVDTSVKDGGRIVLRRGRLLNLTVDGRRTQVWTTAPTVSEALSQLGYSTSDFVSVSRSRRLPLGATDIAIRTPQLVTIVHDGEHEQVTTTDATVGQLLDDLQIAVSDSDHLSPAPSTAVSDGLTVTIERVDRKLLTKTVTTPFTTKTIRDDGLFVGTTKVVHPGRAGQIRVTYSVVYLDGKPIGRTRIKTVVLRDPSTRVVKIGTKAKPVKVQSSGASQDPTAPTAPAPSPGSAKAIARQLLEDRGWGDNQYDCLVTLWNHESGWRVHAANPSGAYGIPQALPGSKMASAGPDWQNNAETQIKWGLDYIKSRYGTPCGAWSSWQANGGWY